MAKQNKIELAFRYLNNRDYRDYRRIRFMSVLDSDYFLMLLKKNGCKDLVKGFINATDQLWFYFQVSREQISSVEISRGNWLQLLDPHPLFDTYFYLAHYRKQIGSRHPFSHYLLDGWKSNLKPGPFFDPDYYQENCGWHETYGNPLLHYLNYNLKSAKDCSIFFSHEWYLDKTPLREAAQDFCIRHYKLHGASEGKSPVPVFDPQHYVQLLDRQSRNCTDPLLHYISAGERAGISPNPYFDLEHYRDHYQNRRPDGSPMTQYISVAVFNRGEIHENIASLPKKTSVSLVVPDFNPKPE